MPFFSHQTEATITLYQSAHEETRYVTDEGVGQLKGEMKLSDPKWKDCFIPVMSKAISALRTFISGHLFDKLLQSSLITSDQYERLTKLDRDSRSIRKSESSFPVVVGAVLFGHDSTETFLA